MNVKFMYLSLTQKDVHSLRHTRLDKEFGEISMEHCDYLFI